MAKDISRDSRGSAQRPRIAPFPVPSTVESLRQERSTHQTFHNGVGRSSNLNLLPRAVQLDEPAAVGSTSIHQPPRHFPSVQQTQYPGQPSPFIWMHGDVPIVYAPSTACPGYWTPYFPGNTPHISFSSQVSASAGVQTLQTCALSEISPPLADQLSAATSGTKRKRIETTDGSEAPSPRPQKRTGPERDGFSSKAGSLRPDAIASHVPEQAASRPLSEGTVHELASKTSENAARFETGADPLTSFTRKFGALPAKAEGGERNRRTIAYREFRSLDPPPRSLSPISGSIFIQTDPTGKDHRVFYRDRKSWLRLSNSLVSHPNARSNYLGFFGGRLGWFALSNVEIPKGSEPASWQRRLNAYLEADAGAFSSSSKSPPPEQEKTPGPMQIHSSSEQSSLISERCSTPIENTAPRAESPSIDLSHASARSSPSAEGDTTVPSARTIVFTSAAERALFQYLSTAESSSTEAHLRQPDDATSSSSPVVHPDTSARHLPSRQARKLLGGAAPLTSRARKFKVAILGVTKTRGGKRQRATITYREYRGLDPPSPSLMPEVGSIYVQVDVARKDHRVLYWDCEAWCPLMTSLIHHPNAPSHFLGMHDGSLGWFVESNVDIPKGKQEQGPWQRRLTSYLVSDTDRFLVVDTLAPSTREPSAVASTRAPSSATKAISVPRKMSSPSFPAEFSASSRSPSPASDAPLARRVFWTSSARRALFNYLFPGVDLMAGTSNDGNMSRCGMADSTDFSSSPTIDASCIDGTFRQTDCAFESAYELSPDPQDVSETPMRIARSQVKATQNKTDNFGIVGNKTSGINAADTFSPEIVTTSDADPRSANAETLQMPLPTPSRECPVDDLSERFTLMMLDELPLCEVDDAERSRQRVVPAKSDGGSASIDQLQILPHASIQEYSSMRKPSQPAAPPVDFPGVGPYLLSSDPLEQQTANILAFITGLNGACKTDERDLSSSRENVNMLQSRILELHKQLDATHSDASHVVRIREILWKAKGVELQQLQWSKSQYELVLLSKDLEIRDLHQAHERAKVVRTQMDKKMNELRSQVKRIVKKRTS